MTTRKAPGGDAGPTFLDALRIPMEARVPLLAIAGHPDDEIIGMGAQLAVCPRAMVVHLTDGAPANMGDALRLGFDSRQAYASARRAEGVRALAKGGISCDSIVELNIQDQSSSYDVFAATCAILAAIERARPAVIVTHPYEGGHPDHDTAAFATHTALRISRWACGQRPALIEFASYHLRGECIETSAFLRKPKLRQHTVVLSSAERELKRRMIACHASQRAVLESFPTRIERFRFAPAYDFSQPPYPGQLYYERFDWGISGSRWRANARAALHSFGLKGLR